MLRSPVLDEIRRLDPVRDHQRIVFLSCRVDFPWDTTRALELALFRTFAIPSISSLLDQTREFACRPQKRYDDTDIIVSEIMEHGYDSERGLAAIRRMNAIHARFDISNDDYLYVLSTFVCEPIRWNARFGWRRMIPAEQTALFHFWRETGRRMGIRDIPETEESLTAFSARYEQEHFRFGESNRRTGEATRELFASWFPRLLRPLVRRGIHALLDDPLREAFGFPRPSAFLRSVMPALLRTRALSLRAVWPRRRSPLMRSEMKRPSYPAGHSMETIGPEHGPGQCPFHAPPHSAPEQSSP